MSQESCEIVNGPGRLINVFALRRAGQHALVDFLRACCDATGLSNAHANDVDNNLPADHPARWYSTPQQVVAKGAGRDVLLANYEDFSYANRSASPIWRGLTDLLNRVPTTDIVLVRDFYNLAATRLQRFADAQAAGRVSRLPCFSMDHAVGLWLEHATFATEPEVDAPMAVVYNQLAHPTNGAAYRAQLAERLGLQNAPNGMSTVSHFGGGSTFDGQNYDGQPHAMNVHHRWLDLSFELRPAYLQIIDNPQVDALNRQVFGFGREEVMRGLATNGLRRAIRVTA